MKISFEKFKVPVVVIFLFLAVVCTSCRSEIKESPKGRVAVLVAEGFHDGEAFMPMGYLQNDGYHITVLGLEKGTVKAYNSDFTINIEKAVSEVTADQFDALVLPGGRGPALLRENDSVIEFVQNFWETGKVTAAICHGPQVLISAGVLNGKNTTGVGGIQEELEAAGVQYVDRPVVVDANLITSRVPQDLYDFSKSIADALEKQLN